MYESQFERRLFMYDNEQLRYDICIDQLELNKLRNIKSYESIFVNPPNTALSLEGFQQLLPPMMKFGRIFRLRKNKVDYNVINIISTIYLLWDIFKQW